MAADVVPPRLILVAGATGYVGARLVPRLVAAGHRVRAMGRSLEKLQARPWADLPGVELVAADIFEVGSLDAAFEGVEAVYYLIHSMQRHQDDFAEADRVGARNVAQAAARAGVKRILYLSGLGEEEADLSQHLRSRAEVGRVLQSGSVPVTIFRAAIILGSGSASFEILRFLTDRLPVMVAPRWLSTPVQPIAIRDVLAYLVESLDHEETIGTTFDIGGPDVTTYIELMQLYAREAGLRKRIVLMVPVLTPRLSSLWIRLVTPAPASLVRPLAEGLRNPVICREANIQRILPRRLLTSREAIRLALAQRVEEPSLNGAPAARLPAAAPMPGDAEWTQGKPLSYVRSIVVDAPRARVWEPISQLAERRGGASARRAGSGRGELHAGDIVDPWRVSEVVIGDHVRLVMRKPRPGATILDISLRREAPARTRITQTFWSRPRGLPDLVSWYLRFPMRLLRSRRMLRRIARSARRGGHA